MIEISLARHAYPENAGFIIDRQYGHSEYTFLHFYNSVEILKNGELIKTQPHAVILYRPRTPQYYISKEPLLHDWFHFSGDIDELGICEFMPDEIYYPANCDFISKTVAELESEFFGNRKNSEVLSDLKVRELFVKLDRFITEKENDFINTETIEKFRYLRGEIFSSLDGDWSVSNMAKRINLSESRFFTLYKRIFGTTPTADLINAKINSAKNMLLFHNERIEDIAACLGYENTTHFIRQFKKSVGTTPSGYRKKHRNGTE